MHPLIRPPGIPVALVAQDSALPNLGARLSGIGTQAVAFLLGLAVTWGLLWLLFNLMKSMLKKPSFETLAMIVGLAVAMVFLAGASTDLLNAAYAYGQTFLDGGGAQ